jgi:two-component system KDP operon response regulator KdpE
MKVLVIEDDQEVVDSLSLCLGFASSQANIFVAADGDEGIHIVETESPDMVILDLELSDADSFKVVKQIRSFSDVPIIVLSAKEAEMEKVKALQMGADDYIIKPFSPIDLMAKVKAVLRRATMPQFRDDHSSTFTSGNLTINFATHEVFVSGKLVKLSPTEYNLLCNLVRNEGRVLNHRFLLEKTWGSGYTDDISFLKKYIYRLRVKLNDSNPSRRILVNVRGTGYRFVRTD